MKYLHVLYRSRPTHGEFDETDLDILKSALAFNSENGITGLLVRVDEQFYQALHGPKDAVSTLLAKIENDPRHTNMEILLSESAAEVSPYGEWAMAYDSLIGFENDLGAAADGNLPEITAEKARHILGLLADLARGVAEFGSAFPYSRQFGETDAAYMERLGGLA
ncbi:BLUF domain-containing protein [Celeribacter litoreus]|uniref:BLUF domain-containing protein n=1 Tax=Celeribacter litoreus TaxID=2876714 RepID=UPI001CCBA048|nr:BLUF domain-containing protein [Celeribacter litoreus]MCA0044185.1 BLUF domain-containing protein [Celeribacter litoreus]